MMAKRSRKRTSFSSKTQVSCVLFFLLFLLARCCVWLVIITMDTCILIVCACRLGFRCWRCSHGQVPEQPSLHLRLGGCISFQVGGLFGPEPTILVAVLFEHSPASVVVPLDQTWLLSRVHIKLKCFQIFISKTYSTVLYSTELIRVSR